MRHIDLEPWHQTMAGYKERIATARASAQALACAEQCLCDLEYLFDKELRRIVLDEAAYLWALFPDRVKTLGKYKELLIVLLGQTMDFHWYADMPRYCTDKDVRDDRSLYSFRRGDPEFEVRFIYVQYYSHILMRIPNALRLRYRRIINHPGKYTQGLTTTRCRPAIAGLLNQLSEAVTATLHARKPFPILVNSVLRTVEYQDSLARIGYVAPRASSHLAGYGVDIEQRWYREHHAQAHGAIRSVLSDLFARNVVNLIDEGTHWHLCLNPIHIQPYEALFKKWEGRAQ